MLARLCDHMYTLYAALNRNFKIYKTYFYYIKLMGLIYFLQYSEVSLWLSMRHCDYWRGWVEFFLIFVSHLLKCHCRFPSSFFCTRFIFQLIFKHTSTLSLVYVAALSARISFSLPFTADNVNSVIIQKVSPFSSVRSTRNSDSNN